jgi:hypothetical protein
MPSLIFHVETQYYHHEMLVKAWSLLIIYKTHAGHNNLVSSLIVETESRCFQMDHRLLMLPPPLSLCTRRGPLGVRRRPLNAPLRTTALGEAADIC